MDFFSYLYIRKSNSFKWHTTLRTHPRNTGGLIKGARNTQCESLYLIVCYGKSEELRINGHTIHKLKFK